MVLVFHERFMDRIRAEIAKFVIYIAVGSIAGCNYHASRQKNKLDFVDNMKDPAQYTLVYQEKGMHIAYKPATFAVPKDEAASQPIEKLVKKYARGNIPE